jgi:hypothetical protein
VTTTDREELLNDLNADLSDALDALENRDVSRAIGLIRAAVNAVRAAIDEVEATKIVH